MTEPADLMARLEISALIAASTLARDTADWAGLTECWHPDGRVRVTWFQGPVADFVAASRRAWDAGASVIHTVSGSTVRVAGSRGLAETRVTITVRADIDGVACDVATLGRLFDFVERRQGRWGIVLREAAYDRDRIDAVRPGEMPVLPDDATLARYPVEYRYLAHVLERQGHRIDPDLPTTRNPAMNALRDRCAAWLAGAPDPAG